MEVDFQVLLTKIQTANMSHFDISLQMAPSVELDLIVLSVDNSLFRGLLCLWG